MPEKKKTQNIAILTSGGDSPGMNAAVLSVVRNAYHYGLGVIGIMDGYKGLLEIAAHLGIQKESNLPQPWNENDNAPSVITGEDLEQYIDSLLLDRNKLLEIADLPGTYLRTARCREFLDPEMRKVAAKALRRLNCIGLVVVGGDGSFHGAEGLNTLGIPCVGIPGTIDNDLAYTEITLGFDTAVNTCMEAVRAVRATSRSHGRQHIVEVMGRDCGDIALRTAVASGAEIVLVKEVPWSVENVAHHLDKLISDGNSCITIVAAEGCWDSIEPKFDVYEYLLPYGKQVYPNEPMTSSRLASVLNRMCANAEIRNTVVGYVQRGASPTARDNAFAFEAGVMAVELLKDSIGHGDFISQAIGVRDGRTFHMSLKEALDMQKTRRFNDTLYRCVNDISFDGKDE